MDKGVLAWQYVGIILWNILLVCKEGQKHRYSWPYIGITPFQEADSVSCPFLKLATNSLQVLGIVTRGPSGES